MAAAAGDAVLGRRPRRAAAEGSPRRGGSGPRARVPQQLGLLLVAMVTSKGASGVTGAGFVTLAATLAAVPAIPIESLALLIGIDRFMSMFRAAVNVIGNGVATLVIARWEKELDAETLQARL